MKKLFRATPTLGPARKTVADVLAGFNRVIDDLNEVQAQNQARAQEAQEKIAKAQAELASAQGEIAGATVAINNITSLIGGTPESRLTLLQAAE